MRKAGEAAGGVAHVQQRLQQAGPGADRRGTVRRMKLPGSDRAVVELAKLANYCLDETHPRGRHEARVFAARLGLGRPDAALLRAELLRAAATSLDALEGVSDGFWAALYPRLSGRRAEGVRPGPVRVDCAGRRRLPAIDQLLSPLRFLPCLPPLPSTFSTSSPC